MKFQLFYLVIILSVSIACKKDPPPPPPCTDNGLPCPTTEGKNTFGCKVDGVNWIAKTPVSVGGPVPIYGSYNNTNGELYLHAVWKDNNINIYEYINIYISGNVHGTGTYNITAKDIDNDPIVGYKNLLDSSECSSFSHDSLNMGTINISYLNTTSYIVSGTFEMNLKNSACPDSIISITEGRFDLSY